MVVFRIPSIDVTAFCRVVWFIKMLSHCELAPPIDIKTFLPYCCHVFTKVQGKLALSIIIVPLLAILANARIIKDVFAFESSVCDCPQKSPENPQ